MRQFERQVDTLMIVALVVAAFLVGRCRGAHGGGGGGVRSDTVRTVRVDTVWRTDSAAVAAGERVVRYVTLRPESKTSGGGVVADSNNNAAPAALPVVQREYRDSGYVAWVSGPQVADSIGPRLDSIRVRELTATESVVVTNTVTRKPPRWSVGLTGGYGIGLQSGRAEPFVGVGVSWRLWP